MIDIKAQKRKRRGVHSNGNPGAGPRESVMGRRSFLSGLPVVAGGVFAAPLVLSSAAQAAPAPDPTEAAARKAKEPITLPDFRISLVQQRPRELPGGAAREASAVEFPVSKSLAGVLMTLTPGGLRELHWDANAAEWAYVGDGPAEMILVFNSGEYQEISLSTVLATSPAYLLETNFRLPKAVVDKLPKKTDFITTGRERRQKNAHRI